MKFIGAFLLLLPIGALTTMVAVYMGSIIGLLFFFSAICLLSDLFHAILD